MFFICFYKIIGCCLYGPRLMPVCGAREGTDWCHFAPAKCVTQGDCAGSTFYPGRGAEERAGLVALDLLHHISSPLRCSESSLSETVKSIPLQGQRSHNAQHQGVKCSAQLMQKMLCYLMCHASREKM